MELLLNGTWLLLSVAAIAHWLTHRHPSEQERLRLLRSEVEPVLVHDHLHVLEPHLPGFLGNVFVDTLAERMIVEGRLVEAGKFLVQLDAENFVLHGVAPESYLTARNRNSAGI